MNTYITNVLRTAMMEMLYTVVECSALILSIGSVKWSRVDNVCLGAKDARAVGDQGVEQSMKHPTEYG